MKIGQRVYSIIVALYNANILLARGDDIALRRLTEMMAQQLKFELGPSWGYKRTAITYMEEDGSVWEYDWQDKNTKKPHSPPGEMMVSTSRTFTPVFGMDHLRLAEESKDLTKELRIAGE